MTDNKLQSKLDGYTQDVQARAASRSSWKKHLKSWPVYTTAGGASLAMVANAGAGVIYSGLQNLTVENVILAGVEEGSEFKAIAIGSGGGVKMFASFALYGLTQLVGLEGAAINNGSFLHTGPDLKKLGSGAVISSGGTFGGGKRFAAVSTFSSSTFGNFFPPANGFVGVKLNDPQGTHYGWIHLNTTDVGKMTAIDWAYNDVANAQIVAGDKGTSAAVPEPATMTMMLLGTGSAGVLAWRRRRKEAASAATA